MNKKDIEKGIEDLVKVINRQKEEITKLKLKLVKYEGLVVVDSWEKMKVTELEALAVIGMFTRNINIARETYGNGN